MSVVVATRDEQGYIHMASDSMVSSSFTDSQLDVCKVNVTFDEDVIIGDVGGMALTMLKYYSLLPQSKYRPVVLDEEYFLIYVREQIINLIQKVDMQADKKGFNGELLIAYKKQLYVFDSNYDMYPVYQKSYSIGSGEYHASSAIKILDTIDGLTIREKLLSSINVTQQYVSRVGE
jgi:ATP-dependent protease HslVU (ClpYQ) peptidase subunit